MISMRCNIAYILHFSEHGLIQIMIFLTGFFCNIILEKRSWNITSPKKNALRKEQMLAI